MLGQIPAFLCLHSALESCLVDLSEPCTAPEGTEPFPNQTGWEFPQDLLSVLPAAWKSSLAHGVSLTAGTPAGTAPELLSWHSQALHSW